jgi:hypothetical protein
MPSKVRKVGKVGKNNPAKKKCIITELFKKHGVLVRRTTDGAWIVQSLLHLEKNKATESTTFSIAANPHNISEIPKCLRGVDILYTIETEFRDKNGKKTGRCKYVGFPGIDKCDINSLCDI